MKFRAFAAGDVVIGPDPFHTNDPTLRHERRRPWLIVSNDSFPPHGNEYLACALTSRRTPFEGQIRLDPVDWRSGGTQKPSKLDPTSVMTIKHAWVTSYAGSLGARKLDETPRALRAFL